MCTTSTSLPVRYATIVNLISQVKKKYTDHSISQIDSVHQNLMSAYQKLILVEVFTSIWRVKVSKMKDPWPTTLENRRCSQIQQHI
uniref:Uncharacterized protein n=1 Tax=Arundo donax TaxID=35708 RepID=A0A0A9DUL4_ARUDO